MASQILTTVNELQGKSVFYIVCIYMFMYIFLYVEHKFYIYI